MIPAPLSKQVKLPAPALKISANIPGFSYSHIGSQNYVMDSLGIYGINSALSNWEYRWSFPIFLQFSLE